MRRSRFSVMAAGWLVYAMVFSQPAHAQAGFPTDEVLRTGMTGIRAAVIDHHTLITHRRLPVAMARSFANNVGNAVSSIRSTTSLPADSRSALAPLLDTIETSAKAIGGGGDSIRQMDALFALTKALETYGRTFDHPDWKPIQER